MATQSDCSRSSPLTVPMNLVAWARIAVASASVIKPATSWITEVQSKMAAIGPALAESISSTRDRLPRLLRTGHPLHTPQSSTGGVGGRPCRLRILRAPGACEENPRSPCRRGPRVDRFREHLERGEEELQGENSSRHGRESVRGVGGNLRIVGATGSRPVCPRADLH